MKEALSLSLARKMKLLLDGERVPASAFPPKVVKHLLEEELFVSIARGSFQSVRLKDPEGLRTFLAQHYDMDGELEQWIKIKSGEEEVKRSEQVQSAGSSKISYTRAFRGFLINCYTPMEATLRGAPIVIHPLPGTSIFMEEYEQFRLPEDVVVVGMENGENFQHIRAQHYLFEGMKVLFVSRYPQSKDLRTWLQAIPNRYIHFGDFDLAGIHIFLTEFHPFLGERAKFLIPSDIEERIAAGSRKLYDGQYAKYKNMSIADPDLQWLVQLIHRYKKGYEQEGYIKSEEQYIHALVSR